jgi:hypothetical protein
MKKFIMLLSFLTLLSVNAKATFLLTDLTSYTLGNTTTAEYSQITSSSVQFDLLTLYARPDATHPYGFDLLIASGNTYTSYATIPASIQPYVFYATRLKNNTFYQNYYLSLTFPASAVVEVIKAIEYIKK